MKTIEIIIGPRGEVQLETRGFAGGTCREATGALVASLGQAVSEQLTAEFYRCETAQESAVNFSPSSLGIPRP